jgi:DNA repair and recombination protein RAD54B
VVFVTPTDLQLSMMRKLLQPDELYNLAGSTARSLALIQTLSKLCTSPYLLHKKKDSQNLSNGARAAIALLPSNVRSTDISLSGEQSSWTIGYIYNFYR